MTKRTQVFCDQCEKSLVGNCWFVEVQGEVNFPTKSTLIPDFWTQRRHFCDGTCLAAWLARPEPGR